MTEVTKINSTIYQAKIDSLSSKKNWFHGYSLVAATGNGIRMLEYDSDSGLIEKDERYLTSISFNSLALDGSHLIYAAPRRSNNIMLINTSRKVAYTIP